MSEGGLTGSIESQVAVGLLRPPDAGAISTFIWLKNHLNQHLGEI